MNKLEKLSVNQSVAIGLSVFSLLMLNKLFTHPFPIAKQIEMLVLFFTGWLLLFGLSRIKPLNFLAKRNYLAILFIGIEIFMLTKYMTEKNEIKETARALIEVMDKSDLVVKEKKTVHFNEPMALLDQISNLYKDLYDKYKDEIYQIRLEKRNFKVKFNECMSPSKLLEKDGIKRAKEFIRLYRDFFVRTREFLNKINLEKAQKITKVGSKNKLFFDSYLLSQKNNDIGRDLIFKIENDLLDASLEIINLIEKNINNLSMENNILMFPNQEQLNLYANYRSKCIKSIEMEESLSRNSGLLEAKIRDTLDESQKKGDLLKDIAILVGMNLTKVGSY